MPNDVKLRIGAKDNTRRAFRSVQHNLRNITSRLTSMQARIGALVGVGGFALLAKRTIEAGDKIQKLSTRLGASTEALSEYRRVAELSGVSFETLTMGWQRMTRRIAEAAQGTGEAEDALRELNVSARDLAQLAPEQQFEILADALARVENQGDRVRLSMKLFDSEGVSLVQTMENGAAGIQAMREEARQMGLSMSQEQADQMAQFNDSLTTLRQTFDALAQQNLPAVFQWLTRVGEYLNSQAIPAFRMLAETVFGFESNIRSLTRDEILARMDKLNEEIDTFSKLFSQGHGTDAALAKQQERIRQWKELNEQLQNLNRSAVQMNDTMGRAPVLPSVGPGDAELPTADSVDPKLMAAIATEERLDELYAQKQEERLEREKEHARMWENVWANSINNFATGIGDAFAGVIVDQRNLAEAMQALMKGVARQVISSLVEIAIKRAIFQAQGEAAKKAIVLSGVASANTLALAYAPAAAAASLASFGANAAPAQAGIASTYGLTQGLALAGQAHDGLDNVPREGTYLLDKGEMVLDKGTSNQVRNNVVGDRNVNINVSSPDPSTTLEHLRQNRAELGNLIRDWMNEEGVRFA